MIAKYGVTYGRNCKGLVVSRGKDWSEILNVPFIIREDSLSLDSLLEINNFDALLISSEKGPQIYSKRGTLFFHTNMATLRKLNLDRMGVDHFALATQLKSGMKYLDCTLGLATDAIIAADLAGLEGIVVGVAASSFIYLITSHGLRNYLSTNATIN